MRWAFAVTLSILLGSAPASAEPRCLNETEAAAEKVQSLQSGLMVAALKCVHKPELFIWERYQMFIDRYAPELQAASAELQGWFDENHGANGNARYEAYVTGLANDYSLTTFGREEFCEAMSALALDVLGISPSQISAGYFETDALTLGKIDGCRFTLETEMAVEPAPDQMQLAFVPELRSKPSVPETVSPGPITETAPQAPSEARTGFSEETLANGERITISDN